MTTVPKLLLIHSHYGEAPDYFLAAQEQGQGVIRRECDLSEADFAQARGLMTTMHLDQVRFLAWKPAVEALLARGGRWVFNGHILRELVSGLQSFVPIAQAKRADLVLCKLGDHPIFDGINITDLEEIKGVAGFYGRGHNPLPQGARPITGIGPDAVPLDWEWRLPTGGAIFCHGGSDFATLKGSDCAQAVITPRLIAWALGDLA